MLVGVGGWRIHNEPEYLRASDFDVRPELTFFVWREGKYSEVAVRSMTRWLPAAMETYPAAPPPA